MKRSLLPLTTGFAVLLGIAVAAYATVKTLAPAHISTAPAELAQATPDATIDDATIDIGERGDYLEIDLSTISSTVELTGTDPEAIALAAFGTGDIAEGEGSPEQIVTVNTDTPDQVIVIVTQTGLLDDSVRGIQYRVDFAPDTSDSNPSANGQWRMAWAGRQQTCYPGRGPQVWTTKLCI
jgi:hypothetical protein